MWYMKIKRGLLMIARNILSDSLVDNYMEKMTI